MFDRQIFALEIIEIFILVQCDGFWLIVCILRHIVEWWQNI